jgi:hypothetical protein
VREKMFVCMYRVEVGERCCCCIYKHVFPVWKRRRRQSEI